MREESYVVRIYRRPRGEGGAVVGVVEAVRTGWQKPFQSFQELTEILAGAEARSAPRGLPEVAAHGQRRSGKGEKANDNQP